MPILKGQFRPGLWPGWGGGLAALHAAAGGIPPPPFVDVCFHGIFVLRGIFYLARQFYLARHFYLARQFYLVRQNCLAIEYHPSVCGIKRDSACSHWIDLGIYCTSFKEWKKSTLYAVRAFFGNVILHAPKPKISESKSLTCFLFGVLTFGRQVP